MLPDRDVLEARPDDLSFVTVEVIDKMERVHPSASPTIYFTVAGEGALAAVGNGNPASEESYRGHARRAYHGRCLVVVKASGEPGTITLRAQADGLAAEEVTLQVVA